MLVNVSGLAGHAMPIDLNIEHLIGELKVSTTTATTTYHLHLPEVTLKRLSCRQRVSSQHGIGLEISRQLWTS